LISLSEATAGQGVIWYTGQFYVLLVFLQTILKINPKLSNIIVAYALLSECPSSPSLARFRTSLAASGS